jgi:hypothetical protein
MDGAIPVKLSGLQQRLATLEAGSGFLRVPIMTIKKWALYHPAARHHFGRNPGPA